MNITKLARACCLISIAISMMSLRWDAAIFFLLALHFYFEGGK
jgi:hypothetical protein